MGNWERLLYYEDLPAHRQVDFFIHLLAARVTGVPYISEGRQRGVFNLACGTRRGCLLL